MKEKRETRLLRLWKVRQEREGKDVSGVKTLKQAEEFYKKKKGGRKKPPDEAAGEEPENEAGESK